MQPAALGKESIPALCQANVHRSATAGYAPFAIRLAYFAGAPGRPREPSGLPATGRGPCGKKLFLNFFAPGSVMVW